MINAEHLTFSYNGAPVLDDLSFSVDSGEMVGIIGPNGAGKSTLLKLLDRILLPSAGSVFIRRKQLGGYSRRELARVIGLVPQRFSTAFNFSAGEIVMMGRFPHQSAFGFDSEQDREIAARAMQATDCYELRKRNFLTLSGGEQQRVVLASALAQEPQILLLDEPTSALDLRHQVHFYRILEKLSREQGITVLTVTHDVNLAAQFCPRILVLKNGRVVADGGVHEVLQKEILEAVYQTPLQIIRHPRTGLPVILTG